MSKSIKFKNNTYLDSRGIVHNKQTLSNILDNYMVGKTRENTVVGSYVKLFTLELSAIWKNCSVLFFLNDSQHQTFSQLVVLSVKKNAANDEIIAHTFKTINFNGNISNQLVAVITSTNILEVYFLMQASQSPTINIIAISKLNNVWEANGKVTIDNNTIVNTLPNGTKKYVTNML